MMRNLIVLGCAGLLAIGLSVAGYAGAPVDTDNDGVPDQHDNCIDTDNGPNEATFACNSQEDGDLDGYGSPCDFDADNDGGTSINDALEYLDEFIAGSTNPVFDSDCDGGISVNDFLASLDAFLAGATPGASGLACASLCAVPAFGCTATGADCP